MNHALPEARKIEIPSTLDGVVQPCRVWRGDVEQPDDTPRPLLISLHTWGGGYDQESYSFIREGLARGWHCIMPHFRGPNVRPEACGSAGARQDVLDAVTWGKANLPVDIDRVYLIGGSGGGHMTMRVVAQAPEVFAAASAWCGITDLAAWHREHVRDGVADHYAQQIEACVGGVPGSSPQVDQEVHDRSPLPHIHLAADVPLDIAHGIHDGKKGSVPFWHSIWAYNRIARQLGQAEVSQREIDELWQDGKLAQPQPGDTQPDPDYGQRAIYLRRQAGKVRLTIFEGGHETVPLAGCQWLAGHSRKGTVSAAPRRAAGQQGRADTIAG